MDSSVDSFAVICMHAWLLRGRLVVNATWNTCNSYVEGWTRRVDMQSGHAEWILFNRISSLLYKMITNRISSAGRKYCIEIGQS